MSRIYYNWDQWNDINKKARLKGEPKKPTEIDKKSRIEKFCKCRICNEQMTYIPNTNILVCENEVEITKTFEKDGIERTTTVKQKCGHINLIDEKYMGYVNFLFN